MNYQNYKTNLLVFLIIIFSILVSTYLWPKIILPYSNPENVIGALSYAEYSPQNDVLRYIVFVGMPIFTFLCCLVFFKKKNLIKFKDLKNIKNNSLNYNVGLKNMMYLFYFFFVVYILIEFISNDLPIGKLDYLHDGDYLTAAKNYSITNNIWISSFSTHGGSMIFYPNIMWKLFGIESIGSYRLFTSFLMVLVKILSIHFVYQLTKIAFLNDNYKSIFFIIFSFAILSMSNFGILTYSYDLISFRDLYLILYLIISFNIIVLDKKNYFNIFLISIIPSVTILLHTDIGIYLNFSLLFYFFYFYIIGENNKNLFILFIILFFWLLCFVLFGFDEIKIFVKNIISISSSIGFTHGLPYPDPFFDIGELKHASRATKGLLLQIVAGLIVSYKIFIKNANITNEKKIFFFLFFLLSFIFFHTALGRSDSFHIRMSCDLPIMIITFFMLEYLLFYAQNLCKINIKKKTSNLFILITFFIIITFSISIKFNYLNIKNFKERYIVYINQTDDFFMNNDTKDLIDYLKVVSLDDKCVQNFTYELAIPYLLNKPSCTPYYSSFLAGSTSLQKDYIDILKKAEPNFIVYKSDKFIIDGIEIQERLSSVNNYINLNYKLHNKINHFLIYKKIM
jgi:hypothetical protein